MLVYRKRRCSLVFLNLHPFIQRREAPWNPSLHLKREVSRLRDGGRDNIKTEQIILLRLLIFSINYYSFNAWKFSLLDLYSFLNTSKFLS
jgi:hypothetical protein